VIIKQTLLSSSLWLIFANGFGNLVLLLFNLTLVRIYGFTVHGKFVYYLTLIALFRLIIDAGLGSMLTKEISNKLRPLKTVLIQAISWTALLNLPIAALIATNPEFLAGRDGAAFSIFTLWFVAMVVENISASIFNGLQSMHLSFFSALIMEGTKLSLIAYLWFLKPSIEDFIIIANLSLFMASLGVVILIAYSLHKLPNLNQDLVSKAKVTQPNSLVEISFLKSALVLWFSTSGALLLPQIMTLLINFGLTSRDVSFYTAMVSWSLIGAVVLAPAANAMFAWSAGHSSELHPTLNASHVSIQSSYYRWIGIISLGCSVLLLGAGSFILQIYGEEMQSLSPAFSLLVLAQLADYPRFFTIPFLSGGGHARASMNIEVTRFILILITSASAIFFGYGLMGIAWSIFVVQLSLGVLRIVHLRRFFPAPLFPAFFRNLSAAIIAYGLESLSLPISFKVLFLVLIFILFSGIRLADFKLIYQKTFPG
jgi:O-antigen/teichoic acid export membrane protein